MIPFRDNLGGARFPFLCAALAVLGAVLAIVDGSLAPLVAGLGVWWAGTGVESQFGRAALLGGVVAGAAAGLLTSPELVAASAGAFAAVAGVALVRLRGARIVSLLLVPTFVTVVELPAWTLVLALGAGLLWSGGSVVAVALLAGFAAGVGGALVALRRSVEAPPRVPLAQRLGLS